MIAVVQRVNFAAALVDGQLVGRIEKGLCVLAAVQTGDTDADVQWLANKLVSMRIFRAGDKNFDWDVRQINGGILLISNFTVAADANVSRRPSLSGAAEPAAANKLFGRLVLAVSALHPAVQTGQFGADMSVRIDNDGPVTFILNSRE